MKGAASKRRQLTIRAVEGDDEVTFRPLQFGLIRRLLRYTRPYAAKRNWLLATVVLRSVQLPALAWALGAVISGPVAAGDARGTIWGVAGFAVLALTTEWVFVYRQRFALELGEAVVYDLRNEIFSHLQRLPMSFYDRTKLGRIISRMVSDVEVVRAGVQDVLFVTLVQGGQMLVAAAIMLWYDWVMFLVVLGISPVIYILNRLLRTRLSDTLRTLQESFSRITATMAETVSGIRVTQGFVRQDVNAALFGELVQDHSRYNMRMARTAGLLVPMLELNSELFIALLLVLGGYRVLTPSISMPVSDLIQFFFLAGIFFSPIQGIGFQYNQAMMAMAGAERVFRLLDTEPEWEDRADARDLLSMEGRVEFRDVWFGYTRDINVLQDVSFVAEPGQTVALVGHTGSGKSTTVSLIAKFYLPTAGELLIDDHPIESIRGESLHHHMGIVQQQNFLFSGTIMENIRVGRPEATDDEVIEAARRLDCLDLLEAMPDGLYTEVGERGASVSLGQRQLICFTRAMLADPRVLVLDEATSSVDSMTESRIQKSLGSLLRGRTSFVIAHRLSTIREADQVLVFDQGRIVERGTHLELLRRGDVYSRLYRQFVSTAASA